MNFSQRIGKVQIKNVLQIDSIDINLKNRLWNVVFEYFDAFSLSSYYNISEQEKVFIVIWIGFFGQTIDDRPVDYMEYMRDWFFKAEWNEIYEFIEFIVSIDNRKYHKRFSTECNFALEKGNSGYRIIEGKIVQITSEREIITIEDAVKNTDKWYSVNTHLQSALDNLSDKINPNYRNSIKESISAVEALCKIILGNDKVTLGEALNEFEKKYKLHNALKKSFSSLYGFTSDSGGIRHSLLEDDVVLDFADAKFMLVSCSAFINYLKVKINI